MTNVIKRFVTPVICIIFLMGTFAGCSNDSMDGNETHDAAAHDVAEGYIEAILEQDADKALELTSDWVVLSGFHGESDFKHEFEYYAGDIVEDLNSTLGMGWEYEIAHVSSSDIKGADLTDLKDEASQYDGQIDAACLVRLDLTLTGEEDDAVLDLEIYTVNEDGKWYFYSMDGFV